MSDNLATNTNERSPFAKATANLLDKTEFFDRKEWASFFLVPESIVSDWTSDKGVPSPAHIRMMLDLLRTRGGTAAIEPLKTFDALAAQPLESISPFGAQMAPTINDYLKLSLSGFGRSLKGLPVDQVIRRLGVEPR